MAKGLLIKTSGKVEVRDFNGLADYQSAVEGYITSVYSLNDDSISGFANDEGLLMGLELNEVASHVFGQYLVGNVVVIGDADERGEMQDARPVAYAVANAVLRALNLDEVAREDVATIVNKTEAQEWSLEDNFESLDDARDDIEHSRWIVVRRGDGSVWRGPFYKNGKSFTTVEKRWATFESRAKAEKAAMVEGINGRWEAVKV